MLIRNKMATKKLMKSTAIQKWPHRCDPLRRELQHGLFWRRRARRRHADPRTLFLRPRADARQVHADACFSWVAVNTDVVCAEG